MLRLGSGGFSYFVFSFPFTHLEVDPSLLGWSRCMWRGIYCVWAERCSEGGKGGVVKWRIWFPLLPLLFFPFLLVLFEGGDITENVQKILSLLSFWNVSLYPSTLLYCIDSKSLFCFLALGLVFVGNGGLVLPGRPSQGKGREGVWFSLC